MLHHLKLNVFNSNLDKKKRKIGRSGYVEIPNRNKSTFSESLIKSADSIAQSLHSISEKTSNVINPSLIYEIKINQTNNKIIFIFLSNCATNLIKEGKKHPIINEIAKSW